MWLRWDLHPSWLDSITLHWPLERKKNRGTWMWLRGNCQPQPLYGCNAHRKGRMDKRSASCKRVRRCFHCPAGTRSFMRMLRIIEISNPKTKWGLLYVQWACLLCSPFMMALLIFCCEHPAFWLTSHHIQDCGVYKELEWEQSLQFKW